MQPIISEIKIDALVEIANIASGNAITSLAQMALKKIDINVPFVKCVDVMEIPSIVANPESIMSGICVSTSGDLKGYLIFVTDFDSYKGLSKLIAGDMEIDPELVISEVINIINGSYLKAISDMLDITVDVSPPEMLYDMLGSILNSFVANISINSNESIILSTNMFIEDVIFEAYYLFLL